MPAKKKRDFGKFAQVAADTDTKKLDHPDDIKKPKPKSKAVATLKKRGRKPTVDYDRDDQLTFPLTSELNNRLRTAVLSEGLKRDPKRVDKGLIIEEALLAYFKKHNY